MPTFRQDVKLGTMVPLVGGSDISDGAITKDKLDKGVVKDIMEEAKLLNEQKKKNKQQIIIGKAIRVKSCDIGAVENWYVQLYDASLYYRNSGIDSAEKIHLKVYEKYYKGEEDYKEIGFFIDETLTHIETGSFVWNLSGIAGKMIRVDRYEEVTQDDGTISLSVWLSYKMLPKDPTIKNISSRYEIINGKRVLRNKKNILKRVYVSGERLVVKFNNFDLYKSLTCVKNKRYRRNYKDLEHDMEHPPLTPFKKRWKKFKYFTDPYKFVGRYKLVVKDRRSTCKQVEYFHIKRENIGSIYDYYVIQKNGI